MTCIGKQFSFTIGPRGCSASPVAQTIGVGNGFVALLVAVICLMVLPLAVQAAPATPLGQGLCSTAVVDGVAREWNTDGAASWDFYQPMYLDGDPAKAILANLYLRSRGGTVYVLVYASSGNLVAPVAAQTWVRNYVFANPLVRWDQPAPRWVLDGAGNVVGFEASFTPPATTVTNPPYEFQAAIVSGGATPYLASTRSKKAGNIKLVMPDCHVGIGDRVYLEGDFATPGYQPEEGDIPAPAGVRIEVVNADSNALVKSTTTDTRGCYLVEGLTEGRYFVRIPKAAFAPGGKLYHATPAEPYTVDASDVDDDADHNGFLDADSGAVVTGTFQLTAGAMPVTNLRAGGVEVSGDRACQLAGALPDPSVNRTLDIALVGERVAIGNLVWTENPSIPGQTEGKFEPAFDTPVNSLTVLLDRIDPSKPQAGCRADSPDIVATTLETTNANGFFLFNYLSPGSFRLRIEADAFSGLLAGTLPSAGVAADGALIDDDTVDHNAIADGDPTAEGVCSATFEVWPGYAPTGEAGARDATRDPLDQLPDDQEDLSRDLAFVRSGGEPAAIMTIGSAVWIDANHDGRQTAGWTDLNKNGVQDEGEVDEPGIADVELVLTGGGLTAAKTTTTAADGTYLFTGLLPGTDYVVSIPTEELANSGHVAVALRDYYAKRGISRNNVPTRALTSVYTAVSWTNKRDGDNNASQTGNIDATRPPNAATATGIELREYSEPRDGAGAGDEFASGHALDQALAPLYPLETAETLDLSGDMTVDFGFVHACQEICDINGDGKVTAADTAVIFQRGVVNMRVDKTNLAHTGNCQQTGVLSLNDYAYCGKLIAPNAK